MPHMPCNIGKCRKGTELRVAQLAIKLVEVYSFMVLL